MIGGGHNAQSDKNAAEAAAFAERMRGVFAELEELSAYRAAAMLNKRGCAVGKGRPMGPDAGGPGAPAPRTAGRAVTGNARNEL